MAIEIGLDPVLVSFGHLHIRWYSLAIMTAIAAGFWLVSRELRRKEIQVADMTSLAMWTIAGGILGARAFHVIDNFGAFRDDPLRVLAFGSGGLAIYGAVAGGTLGVAIGTRIARIPFLPTIDAIAPGLVLAQAIGRIGCIVNGDAWGGTTNLPLAFVYTNPDSFIPNRLLNQPTHPYPLYDIVLGLGILALLLRIRNKGLPNGALFALYISLYATGRFVTSFVREESIWFWGLQQAQVISLVSIVAGGVALVMAWRRGMDESPVGVSSA